MGTQPPTLWTIGHSTRTLDDFLGLLVRHEITALVDVRRFAASRKYPHFNHDALDTSLARAGIEYVPMPDLSKHRQPQPNNHNTNKHNTTKHDKTENKETPEF